MLAFPCEVTLRLLSTGQLGFAVGVGTENFCAVIRIRVTKCNFKFFFDANDVHVAVTGRTFDDNIVDTNVFLTCFNRALLVCNVLGDVVVLQEIVPTPDISFVAQSAFLTLSIFGVRS